MLEAKNISKLFDGKKVLDDFTHSFRKGTVTAIMGTSGCGKTTLLNILMGLVKPDSGKVVPDKGYRKAAVFQENRLCENLSASANIRLVTGKRISDKEIQQALCEVRLNGCADKPAKELSGGMKRRVALLRALLSEYDVLFLDEPFKGLDSETKTAVMEYTKRCIKDRTVILVTHDADECESLADETIHLNAI